MLVGIDEVGRGCLAGPVCVAAVALDNDQFDTVDSKQLTAKKRVLLSSQIRKISNIIGIGWASSREIDEYGISAALKKAALNALLPFGSRPELVLLDGNFNFIEDERVVTIEKGDATIPLIGAASIIAKVARDNYMHAISKQYPEYEFHKHVGYGTALHRSKIDQHGASPIHRMSFAPLKNMKS